MAVLITAFQLLVICQYQVILVQLLTSGAVRVNQLMLMSVMFQNSLKRLD